MGGCIGGWVDGGVICGSMVGHFWTFLLKPPQPPMGLFLIHFVANKSYGMSVV